ncbi:MAG: hypothetical protein CME40_09175 [Haliea sp.]|nr:hypothetical protein [Haliea sp.]|tara:strand:+ start:223801 stop:224607 length:807 start_codon:yes stop_codon:yes gene_type:complete
MGKAAIRLPEKSCFSPVEIAERWGCPVGHVLDYLSEGMLRPAIKAKDLGAGVGLFSDEHWHLGTGDDASDLIDPIFWEGSFLYLSREHICPEREDNMFGPALGIWHFYVAVVSNFDGRLFQIVADDNHCITVRTCIDSMIAARRGGALAWEWHPDNAIITLEERDRFERDHGIVVDGQAATAEAAEPQQEAPAGSLVFPYATRELEAMREAVRRHWEDYIPDKRQPTQKEIAYTLGELLGLPTQGDGTPARKALTLAAAIKPDTLPDT